MKGEIDKKAEVIMIPKLNKENHIKSWGSRLTFLAPCPATWTYWCRAWATNSPVICLGLTHASVLILYSVSQLSQAGSAYFGSSRALGSWWQSHPSGSSRHCPCKDPVLQLWPEISACQLLKLGFCVVAVPATSLCLSSQVDWNIH